MNKINYDNKKFASIENSETGEVSGETVFHYRQKENLVWAEYLGGEIVFGTLIAKTLENNSPKGESIIEEIISMPTILETQ